MSGVKRLAKGSTSDYSVTESLQDFPDGVAEERGSERVRLRGRGLLAVQTKFLNLLDRNTSTFGRSAVRS